MEVVSLEKDWRVGEGEIMAVSSIKPGALAVKLYTVSNFYYPPDYSLILLFWLAGAEERRSRNSRKSEGIPPRDIEPRFRKLMLTIMIAA